jgi:lactoylglutathione lyase
MIEQVVPFLSVSNIHTSVDFYTAGLGGSIKHRWEPGGVLKWCWVQLDAAALMLQEFTDAEGNPKQIEGKRGEGVTLCFFCTDAREVYTKLKQNGRNPQVPYVGNGLWVTTIFDPDGYKIDFESVTSEPEGTIFQG